MEKKKPKKRPRKKRKPKTKDSSKDGVDSPTLFILERLKDVEKEAYKKADTLEQLRVIAKKQEHEHGRHITFLNSKMKATDTDNQLLQTQYHNATNKAEQDMKDLKNKFQLRLHRAEHVFLQKEAQLLERNKQLMMEVNELSLYKNMRHDLQQELDLTKKTIGDNEKRHARQLKELQAKFELAKMALRKEADDRIKHSRKIYKEEVGKELDYESKLVKKANLEMEKELLFHQARSEELVQSNTKLKSEAQKARRGLSQTTKQDREYALRGIRQSKQIRHLKDKTAKLEKALNTSIRDHEMHKKKMSGKHSALKYDLQTRLKQHINLLTVKEKELKMIRKHAGALIRQRNEVEDYFLESLDQIKREIRQERMLKYKTQLTDYNRRLELVHDPGETLEYLKAKPRAMLNGPPQIPSKKVTLGDITQSQRERVLRLTFIKLNQASMKPPSPNYAAGYHPQSPLLTLEHPRPLTSESSTRQGGRLHALGQGGMTFLTDMNMG